MPQSNLILPDARVQLVRGGFKFTEGPAADSKGNIYFSDIPKCRLYRWSADDGKITLFRGNSGGANGNYFDQTGNLISCDGKARRVTSTDPSGKRTVIADSFDGLRLNSPNDLWIDPKGGIYFTDPRYGPMDDLEQDGEHVYYISPDRKNVKRVVSDLTRPNGLIGTADGTTLYVADEAKNKTWVYTIEADGSLGGKRLFAKEGSDGMTIDEQGNVYLTHNAIVIYDPSGKQIARIRVPEPPANCTFGGADRKTLFITARTGVYTLAMSVKGR
ncbi:SMP-30/gluconolactonase/LRE family protein [Candidatus Sumerlaeota bacterium]|nr:SMP-30/gluconolactonase/LRE family protein [Candidatus Sumerlaeota bacterium]